MKRHLSIVFAIAVLMAGCASNQKPLSLDDRYVVKSELDQYVKKTDLDKYMIEMFQKGKAKSLSDIKKLAAMAGAINFYGATALTDGASGAMDAIDGTNLADGDACYTIMDGVFYVHRLNASSGAAESSPDIISPDSNSGNKRWILVSQSTPSTADIAQLTPIDSSFIVGNGSTFVAESGATARTSLGVAIGTNVQAWDNDLDDIADLTPTDRYIMVGNGTDWVTESGDVARISLGVGSTDSPQFTGIELGHASDTTITRASAGDMNIEGNIVYRAGGTDVPIADGGTNSSTALNNDRVIVSSGGAIVESATITTTELGYLNGTTGVSGTGNLVLSDSPALTTVASVTKTEIGVTPNDAYGFRVANTTDAASGAQQWSPGLVFEAQGWKTDATAASQKVEFMQDVRSVQGTSDPTGYWGIYPSIADAAYSATPAIAVTSGGNVGIGVNPPVAGLHLQGGNLIVRGPAGGSAENRFYVTGGESNTSDGVAYLYDNTGSIKIRLHSGGNSYLVGDNVGIGTTTPNQKLTIEGSMSIKEQAAANADTAAYGQVWVKTATPNELYFTDDAGTDTQISSHPIDAPPDLYTNGPGLDWMGKRVQHYLGVIFWQTLNGVITEETFYAYNLRRKDEPGHVDLVKRDWDTDQIAKLRAEKLKEIIEEEVTPDDALESVEIMKDVQISTKAGDHEYTINKDGKVSVKAKTVPVMEKQGTGKFEKKPKDGISFDSKTGKFIRKRNRTESEVDAMDLKAPEMPGWMKTWMENKAK